MLRTRPREWFSGLEEEYQVEVKMLRRDASGRALPRRRLRLKQIPDFFANLPKCVTGLWLRGRRVSVPDRSRLPTISSRRYHPETHPETVSEVQTAQRQIIFSIDWYAVSVRSPDAVGYLR